MFLQIPCPPALRPPWAPGDLASSLCPKFDDGEMQGGGCKGFPGERSKALKSAEGGGRAETPPQRLLLAQLLWAPGQVGLGPGPGPHEGGSGGASRP